MAELLFGVETEYAFASFPETRGFSREALVHSLMDLARARLAHLPDMYSNCGIFLSNSSRLYLDCGLHIEMAGPECSDPWTTVRYVEAGHQIIENLIASLDRKNSREEVLCFRSNVDYSGTGSTWGCHESYLHRSPRGQLQAQLAAFLVTRLIYTGAGGFNPLSPGLEFSLAPRMSYFRHLTSENSTNNRGIWHTKSESLSSGYGRLHILCGESLCSQTAGLLKTGVTALVVALADAGFSPGASVQLVDPIAALHTVARDVTCSEKLETQDGKALSANEIQRSYLEQAMAHLDDGSLPEWAGEVCRLWAETLDNVEAGNCASAQTLDWAIKLALYSNYAGSLLRWDELPALNQAIEKAEAALQEKEGSTRRTSLESLLRAKSQVPETLKGIEAQLESRGLAWADVLNLFENRKSLFAIDMRFGLGPEGIFNTLDRDGVLNHRLKGIGDIEAAMTDPPASGRARVRGEVIRRLSGIPDVRCDWQRIVQYGKERRVLDLNDPFSKEEVWRPLESGDLDAMRMPPEMAGILDLDFGSRNSARRSPHSRREQAYECYVRGEFEAAEELLRACLAEGFERASNHSHLARTLMMMDREAEARVEIELAWAACADAYDYVPLRVLFFRCLFAMLDSADFSGLIGQIKGLLNNSGPHCSWTILPMLDHLRSRLGRRNYQFLKALAAALSESGGLPALERFSQWREAGLQSSAAV
jgi:pup-ligase protein